MREGNVEDKIEKDQGMDKQMWNDEKIMYSWEQGDRDDKNNNNVKTNPTMVYHMKRFRNKGNQLGFP